MSNIKKSFIFIVQTNEGELHAGRQSDIDTAIQEVEEQGSELDFEVIAKIAEPNGPNTLPMDFNEQLIEWYKPDEKRDEKFIKKAVAAITKIIWQTKR